MGQIVSKEKLQGLVGQTSEPTRWFKMEQDRINLFADATLDHQFIHIDEEAAKQTPFGTTIAHGFLSLSMLSHFAAEFGLGIEGVVMGINYGFDKVRIIKPVPVNSRIRARFHLKNLQTRGENGALMNLEVMMEVEGTKEPAIVADWLAFLKLSS